MARVTLKNVSKIFRGTNGTDATAVNGLDLEIQDHEFVVLLGPSHSGISSIVRMLAGLDDISKGDIFIGDRRVNDLPPKDRDVAMVSQDYVPYPRMSVHDNIVFSLKRRKFPNAEIKRRVLEAAGILGLQDLLERKPDSLSGEQRQRVALARALALQPKVFLFDEPLANLEPTTRERMRSEIAKLHQRLQATMIYATHDPIEAMALGDRIVVMNEGAIQQDGTAPTIYGEPANVFVAGFVGHPPMNLVRGALKQERDGFLFSEDEGGTIEVRLPISEFPGAGDFAGGSVLLGIRPEDIRVSDVTQVTEKYSGRFPAIVELVEPLGGEANLYLQTGAHTVVCRVQRQMGSREAGHRLRFELIVGKVCLFDPISRRRIA